MSGDGVYFSDGGLHFYELDCDSDSCIWKQMEQTLPQGPEPITSRVMMYLPEGYTCIKSTYMLCLCPSSSSVDERFNHG